MNQANCPTDSSAKRFFASACLLFVTLLLAGCPSAKPQASKGDSAPSLPASTLDETSLKAASLNETTATETKPDETKPDETKPAETQPDASTAVEATEVVAATQPEPPQNWSVQRVIALQANGPRIVDISVNISGRSLDEATNEATEKVIAYIEKDLPRPWTWEKLLDHPLVRSGWLGNLAADSQQREQLINMYNRNGDDLVDEDEIAPFLSRGLARTAPFKFSNIGYAPGTVLEGSPWQQLDANNDTLLDESEIASIANRLARFDLNADQVLTLGEIQAQRMAAQPSMNSRTDSLMADSTLTINPTDKPARVATELMNKYSMLGSINRETWPDWSDAQWSAFDSNADGGLARAELERIMTAPPNVTLKVSFHHPRDGESRLHAEAGTASTSSKPSVDQSELVWTSRLSTSGQAASKSFAIAVTVNDSFTEANRLLLRNQLTAALKNPQLASAIRAQLQLSENAFEVLDPDRDGQLNDEEFDRVWMWLSAIRGSRVIARWMIPEIPWFQFADADADGRLTVMEMNKFASSLPAMDQDKDRMLAPVEMPTAIRLEIVRTDSRLALSVPQNTEMPALESGWFAASDTNSDGTISPAEFLGSDDDFKAYDSDLDGFISQQEAFNSAAGRVQ